MEEEKKTNKKMEKLPPNYRTLAQLQEQWERAQELKRHSKQDKEEEEPPPETALPGDGGGDTCPVVKATSEGGVEKKKGKGKNEGEGKPRGEEGGVEREGKAIAEEVTLEGEVKKKKRKKKWKKKKKKKEKSDVESGGEGNPRGEMKGGGFWGFKRNWMVEAGESDRAVVKELEIENVVLDSDRRGKVGRAGELSVRRGRGRGRRVMGNRREWTVNAEGSEIENVVVDESDQFLDAVKENVGVDERNLTAEVGREMGKLSVRENVRSDGHRGGYNSGGNRTKWQKRRARRGGGVDNHRDQTVKVGFETENVGVEENVGMEESDQTVEIRRELDELSVREDGVQEDGSGSGHRGLNGGRNGTKGKSIRAGRGRGGMGYHRDRMLKGLEFENVEAERSDQKVENVVEIKDAVGENAGVKKSDRKAEVGLSVRDDEGREDGPSYRHRDHNGGGNMTRWKNKRLGRGRSEMSFNRDRMVKVGKELDMEDLGVEESDQTAGNVVEIKNAVEEDLVVECDQTLEDVLEIKDAVEENVGVESGGTSEVGNWQYGRAGRGGGGGGDRMDYRRGYRRGGYSNGNDRWGYRRSNQRRGLDRNGPVWVRKEDAAAQSKGRVAWEGVKRSVDILS